MDLNGERHIEIDELVLEGDDDEGLRSQLAGILDPATAQAVSQAVDAQVRARFHG